MTYKFKWPWDTKVAAVPKSEDDSKKNNKAEEFFSLYVYFDTSSSTAGYYTWTLADSVESMAKDGKGIDDAFKSFTDWFKDPAAGEVYQFCSGKDGGEHHLYMLRKNIIRVAVVKNLKEK